MRGCFGLLCLVVFAAPTAAEVSNTRMQSSVWEAPGVPVRRQIVDLDDDGRQELLIQVEGEFWDSAGDTRLVDGKKVHVTFPILLERRSLHRLVLGDQGWHPTGPGLTLEQTAFALEDGPPFAPSLLFEANGVSAIRWDAENDKLFLERLIEISWPIDRVREFPGVTSWTSDFNGDGRRDLILPGLSGYEIYLARENSFPETADTKLPDPTFMEPSAGRWPALPIPRLVDLDGDGRIDLVFRGSLDAGPEGLIVQMGHGDGNFDPPVMTRYSCFPPPPSTREDEEPKWSFGDLIDLNRDGRFELVLQHERRPEKDGIRASLRAARDPEFLLAIHEFDTENRFRPQPARRLEFTGYPVTGSWADFSSGMFRDLDGDERPDLVTITLDFSMLQAVRIVTTKKLSIGVNFQVRRQEEDGSFTPVPSGGLQDKLKVDLGDFELRRIAQFSGDLDGDGFVDFVKTKPGRTIDVHRGSDNARYPESPDLVLDLDRSLQNAESLEIVDLDGDGHDDIWVVETEAVEEAGVTPKNWLVIHRSKAER
jgi:hypothetical protein